MKKKLEMLTSSTFGLMRIWRYLTMISASCLMMKSMYAAARVTQ